MMRRSGMPKDFGVANVVGAQHLDHRGPDQAREVSDPANPNGEGRQDQVVKARQQPALFPSADCRQPSQQGSENQHAVNRDDHRRHGDDADRQRTDRTIEEAVATHRGGAPERNAETGREDERGRQQLDGARHMVGQRVQITGCLVFRSVPRSPCANAGQIVEDLHRQRVVEAELFPKGRLDGRRRPRAEHGAGRVAGRGLHQDIEGRDRQHENQQTQDRCV